MPGATAVERDYLLSLAATLTGQGTIEQKLGEWGQGSRGDYLDIASFRLVSQPGPGRLHMRDVHAATDAGIVTFLFAEGLRTLDKYQQVQHMLYSQWFTYIYALWEERYRLRLATAHGTDQDEDAVYRNIPPTPSVEGREAIREFIAEFLATLDGIDFIVHRQISDHGVVMHERTDVLRRKDGVEISVPIMGVFEIADGKIATWRDYFDTAITSAFSS